MKELFLTYEQSLALKELGFDELCFGYYDENKNFNYMFNGCPENFSYKKFPQGYLIGWVSAPLRQQAFEFFREKYNIHHDIVYAHEKGKYHVLVKNYIYGNNNGWPSIFSYEEAINICIDKLIETAKLNTHESTKSS